MHIPVLQKEVLEYLDPKPNENFIDCTLGEGGHTLAILERILPGGKILGIDWSEELIKSFKFQVPSSKKNIILVCDNFANLKEVVRREKFKSIFGILFDLGMSSWHLEKSERGFSFLRNEPLDMRYNPMGPLTAEKIVNYWSEIEIEKLLREYGEERFSKEIAQRIIKARKFKPIENTFHLVKIVRDAVPVWYQHKKMHFATKTFQAIRITVNDELNNLEKVLPQTIEILKSGGRLVIISFHSLEDRIVKNFYKNQAKNGLVKVLTKKPIEPAREEIKINPRSRSAKLRAAVKI
jgi:16S rRNA (cytosine1402-N4)-methyltransferase